MAAAHSQSALLDLEELEARDLENIRESYARLARQAREELRRGYSDTGTPDV